MVKKQLDAHVKRVHVKYECEKYDKVFNFEILLERHTEAAHEDIQKFWHFLIMIRTAHIRTNVYSFQIFWYNKADK